MPVEEIARIKMEILKLLFTPMLQHLTKEEALEFAETVFQWVMKAGEA